MDLFIYGKRLNVPGTSKNSIQVSLIQSFKGMAYFGSYKNTILAIITNSWEHIREFGLRRIIVARSNTNNNKKKVLEVLKFLLLTLIDDLL